MKTSMKGARPLLRENDTDKVSVTREGVYGKDSLRVGGVGVSRPKDMHGRDGCEGYGSALVALLKDVSGR